MYMLIKTYELIMNKRRISLFVTILPIALMALYISADREKWQSIVLTTPIPSPMTTPARDSDLLPIFETVISNDYQDYELPCWWGLKPNETTIDDIVDFAQRLNFDRQWELSQYASTISFEEYLRLGERFVFNFQDNRYDVIPNVEVSFGFTDDILTTTTARLTNPNIWLTDEANTVGLSQILSRMDELPN